LNVCGRYASTLGRSCARAAAPSPTISPSNLPTADPAFLCVPTAMSDNSLAALPIELLYNILSYSIWNTPDGSRTHVAVTTGGKPELWTNHTYYTVAATSRHLRDVVESFCRHLIILHKSTTKLQPPAKKSKNPTPNRVRWVKWTAKHCIFCGKETTCMALMYSSIRCCRKCDKKEWPDKIVSPLELL
jgi:hypothetical protein